MEFQMKLYHPLTFDLDKIEPITSAFIEYCYIGEDKYELVERESNNNKTKHSIYFFKNGEQISESIFLQKTNKRFFIEKNRVVFLQDDYICFLDIYIKPNYQILPVITIEFGTKEEMDSFKPQDWFGQEVSKKFYNEKALWHSLQAVPE
jgi:CYTH domain-containing protein